jgi:hypothetical protein
MAKQKKIFRRKITSNFVRIQNDILENKNLSLKAKGLLCIMLSRKDDWDFHKMQVQQFSKDGRDGSISAFNELIKAGYIKAIPKREKGKFKGYDYIVYDYPATEKPITEKPATDNPPLITTDNNKTDLNKTYNNKTYRVPGNSATENAVSLFEKYKRGEIELDAIINYTNNK